jgi:hypothetical protein
MDSCLTHVFIFILLTFGIAFANKSSESKTGTFTGKVYDAALNQPLPYAKVLLLTPCVLDLKAVCLSLKMEGSIERVNPFNSDLITVLEAINTKPNLRERDSDEKNSGGAMF